MWPCKNFSWFGTSWLLNCNLAHEHFETNPHGVTREEERIDRSVNLILKNVNTPRVKRAAKAAAKTAAMAMATLMAADVWVFSLNN